MSSEDPQKTFARAVFEVLHPKGFLPEVEWTPLAPRLGDLSGKTVYIINSWPGGSGSQLDDIMAAAGAHLAGRFPNVRIVAKAKPSAYMSDDKELWDEMVETADAFLYGAAPSAATTTHAVRWSAGLERRGLPGIPIIFDSFSETAQATAKRLGIPMRLVSVPYPPENLSEERISALMGRIAESLTAPLSEEERQSGTCRPPRAEESVFRGTLEEIEEHFYRSGSTDGLPIVAPTKEKVLQMLKGTSHPPDEVVTTRCPPEGWAVTVEKVAVNGVMAGCRPEYMPVLLATVEAFSAIQFSTSVRSTNSFSYMRVVNGPIGREIGMNPGTFALGPGNRANAAIGRFLSLAVLNLGGGRLGINLMGTQGNVSGYAFCFPENEEKSPWESLGVEMGYGSEESTLTMFGGGWAHTGNFLAGTLEDLADGIAGFQWPNGITVLMAPARARALAEKGMSKEDVKDLIWSHAALPMGKFRGGSYYKKFIEPMLRGKPMYGERDLWPKEYLGLKDDEIVPVYPRRHVYVIVVGGDQNPMMQGWKMSNPRTVSIDKWR